MIMLRCIVFIVDATWSPQRSHIIRREVPLFRKHTGDFRSIVIRLQEVLIVNEANQLLIISLKLFYEYTQVL